MKGYIFEYYKYVRYLRDSLDVIRDVLHYDEAEHSILTFGDYDRLKINVVNDFSRFRELSAQAKTWVGNRQSILLYELDDTPPFDYYESGDKYGFMNQKTGELDSHLFFALTKFNFRSELHKKVNYNELLTEASNYLKQIIKSAGKDIDFMIMGSLGIFGIVVLWFSDQYTEILQKVDEVRVKHGELFWAAHTTISKNSFAHTRKDFDEKVAQIAGQAFLRITTKEPINKLGILKQFNIGKIIHTSGEYDIAIEITAADVYRDFENKEIFDHDKDIYQNLFLQTHITLGEDPVELQPKEFSPKGKPSDLHIKIKDVNKIYENIRELIEQKIDKTAGLIDTLDSLLCDYRYNVVSADNESWAEDFSYIFYKNLQCIKEILLMKGLGNGVFMELLRNIMNNLKQQIFHVAESNMLNFEIPKCHLRYTGQEDSIMFCYMGIIKEILRTAYMLESCNKQSEIIPLVTVDVVPVIESELYFDKSCDVADSAEDQDFKILSLNLPHVTFYDIPAYMQYMYHEIYHYIVPRNRENRNYHIGIVLTTLQFSNMISEYLKEILGGDRNKEGKVCKIIEPLLYKYIYQVYPVIHRAIVETEGGVINNHAVVLVAGVYKDKVWEYLKSYKGYELWKTILQKVWEEIKEDANKDILWLTLVNVLRNNSNDIHKLDEFFSQSSDILEKVWNKYSNRREFLEHLNKIMDGIKEASADIPMIRFSNMPLDEYLLYYSNCLKNNLVKPEEMDLREDLKELIRLGMILSNYAENDEIIENCRDSYRYKYIAKYFTCTEKHEKTIWDKFRELFQEADKWLEFFENSLERYLKQYQLFSFQMHAIWNEIDVKDRLKKYDFNENADRYFLGYRKACNRYAEALKELWNNYMIDSNNNTVDVAYWTAKREYENALFRENIKLFHLFQKQNSLHKLSQINASHNENKEALTAVTSKEPKIILLSKQYISCRNRYFGKPVYGMKDFIDRYMKIVEALENSCENVFGKSYPFWYRGQNNSSYGLLPSIMRSNVNLKGKVNYLAQFQRQLFEEFKYRADGAPEIMDRSFFNASDYLTLMQHYSVSTTLMDWSEDIFSALYFAMEEVLNHQKRNADQNAAVFIFSPHLYNEARNYMMKNEAGATSCTETAFESSMKTVEGFGSGIPNIGAKYNEILYDAFLLGNMSYESPNLYGYNKEVKLCGKEEMAYLPVAVYTSRLNPRIRAQSGIFLAYNLYAEPSIDVKGAYDYIALEKIQEYYLTRCQRPNGKVQFLYKIEIDKSGMLEMVNAVRKMGISKERIYPELTSIGERINYRE